MADDRVTSGSVLEVKAGPLARVYAQGLLDLLQSNEQAEAVRAELLDMIDLMNSTEGLEDLLCHSLIETEQRVGIIGKLFGGRTSEAVEGLLVVLGRRGRMPLFRLIVEQYCSLLDSRQGKLEAIVTSAVVLDESRREEIRRAIKDWTGRDVVMKLRVDSELLGGILVRIGDKLYDFSISGRLRNLNRDMVEKMKSLKSGQGQAGLPEGSTGNE